MAFWLIYERCDGCEQEACLQCRKEERALTLRVVEADEAPLYALNGPCATREEIVQRMGRLFALDRDDRVYFRVNVEGES